VVGSGVTAALMAPLALVALCSGYLAVKS
jgi:hypothetical protein